MSDPFRSPPWSNIPWPVSTTPRVDATCKITKRPPPPQCAVDCYECGPPCKVLADRERVAAAVKAVPLVATKTRAQTDLREVGESDVAKTPGLPPKHPIYKWTGPVPWDPEEF